MPFPSSATPHAETLQIVRNHVRQVRDNAQGAIAAMAAGPVDTNYIVRLLADMSSLVVLADAWKAVPGIDAAATALWPSYAGTFTTDVASVQSAVQGAIDWVVTNFPKDANGWMLGFQLQANGTLSPRSFTVAQTAGLRTALQGVLNAVA